MPRNLHGGSKAKKSSNKTNQAASSGRVEFIEKSNDGSTVYGRIVRKLGCGFVDVFTEEKKNMRCSIRGKFMKRSKSWGENDIVIVDKMECVTSDQKGMIVAHLSKEQVRLLEKRGDIDRNTFVDASKRQRYNTGNISDDEFEFDNDDNDDKNKYEEEPEDDDELFFQNPNRPSLYQKKDKNENSESESDSDIDNI